ncbi:MAG: radical SAM protein [Candidatus Moranbacteria bacterium]|nr:radical SAM protein [Candidatus Moranbacteria bacterium]
MPKLSNILICDMPLRFDTYKGCSHACNYCFVKLKTDISKISNDKSAQSLLNFINKRRRGEVVVKIFDYDIPIHWGGVSDPFQPIEKERKTSLQCLKVFRETKYPFVISTKNALLATDEYLDVLKDCNCAVQYSAICSKYDSVEPGASTFLERVEAMKKIASKGIRVIVRAQPLLPASSRDLINNIPLFKEAGVYGIIVEFMKYKTKKLNTVKVRGDHCFEYKVIKPIFDEIKQKANSQGIKVFAGENRLRQYGDGLNCCGVGDLWDTHKLNLNHILFDNEKIQLSKSIFNKYGGNYDRGFVVGGQITKNIRFTATISYANTINLAMTDKSILSNYTIDKQAFERIKNFKPFGIHIKTTT